MWQKPVRCPVVEMFRKRRRQGGAAEAETFLAQAMIRSLPHNVRRFLLQCIHHLIGPSPPSKPTPRGGILNLRKETFLPCGNTRLPGVLCH
jgi:hypothetical protein